MARTNIEIDEELINRVMKQHGFSSKREAVDSALRRLAVEPFTREEILALEGSDIWHGDLDEMRGDRKAFVEWREWNDAKRSD